MLVNFIKLVWWKMVYKFWKGLFNLSQKLSSYYYCKGDGFKGKYTSRWGWYSFGRRMIKAKEKFRECVQESRGMEVYN